MTPETKWAIFKKNDNLNWMPTGVSFFFFSLRIHHMAVGNSELINMLLL